MIPGGLRVVDAERTGVVVAAVGAVAVPMSAEGSTIPLLALDE